MSSFLGRAGIVGLDRAVEVLDTLGSSVSNLNSNSGFISGMASRGNRITILAFEIANTISKGANLVQSLSKENVQFLKNDVLKSEGVQQLVSSDMKELLSIAAADKRYSGLLIKCFTCDSLLFFNSPFFLVCFEVLCPCFTSLLRHAIASFAAFYIILCFFIFTEFCREEFDVFSREVVRFGDLCKDPQWHNMGRFFSR